LNDVVIRAEGLGKKYVIGHESERERYTALRDIIGRRVKDVLRATSDMVRGRALVAGDTTEEFWALKDVYFEINRGEVVGIIGRNGAGKSTLLKVLSRITEPTKGRVEIRGRVASLLEVGTGFHPELTGRENIYLNGAILGMTRAEVRRKFDAIVTFAEVERFLDTPVKRYSSGMYVRLAFSVAAHLEPDILVVDEVLAVGDTEFQKKCMGKMEGIASGGRTVLLVSHNMAAIANLATRCLLLQRGTAVFFGEVDATIVKYNALSSTSKELVFVGSGKYSALRGFRLLDENGKETAVYVPGQPIRLEVRFETNGKRLVSVDVFLSDRNRRVLAFFSTQQFEGVTLPTEPGEYDMSLTLEGLFLAAGSYEFGVATGTLMEGYDHHVEKALAFEVVYCNPRGMSWNLKQSDYFGALGLLRREDTPIKFSRARQETGARRNGA
jgi:lipopolysaccharide transport system ATP-binding protein